MFIQVIKAKAADPAALERQWHRWQEDLAPGSIGYLGATGGITTKGIFIMAARFEDEKQARSNQDRSEQGAWWAETEKALDGPTFQESTEVSVFTPGSDDAGFVQMIQADVSDRARFDTLESALTQAFEQQRPDLIGGYRMWLPGSRAHVVNYFTSEAEARAGETKELPADLKARFDEWTGLMSNVEWFDINEPWISSR
ncbi:MAG TPA: hypothetical protein VGB52_08930 [Actinomycetota bacterium]